MSSDRIGIKRKWLTLFDLEEEDPLFTSGNAYFATPLLAIGS